MGAWEKRSSERLICLCVLPQYTDISGDAANQYVPSFLEGAKAAFKETEAAFSTAV